MKYCGLTALAVACSALLIRVVPINDSIMLTLVAASPYWMLGAVIVAVALFIAGRKWLLACVTVLVAVVGIAVQIPLSIGNASAPPSHIDVRVLTANLRNGKADPEFFVKMAGENADLVAVQELTPLAAYKIGDAGMEDQFPYSATIPVKGAYGIGIWSRFPLDTFNEVNDDLTLLAVRLRIPHVKSDPVFASIHVRAPDTSHGFLVWQKSIAAAREVFDDLAGAANRGATIVAGDFNSTPEMSNFRQLLTNGFRTAVNRSGIFAPTFPDDRWFPPLLAIDHVLIKGATSSSFDTFTVPGSDHRALLVTVEIPPDSTP